MDEQNRLCWGSLAYCCSLEKDCGVRNSVMKRIKLSGEDYIRLKQEFDKKVIKIIKDGKAQKAEKISGNKI